MSDSDDQGLDAGTNTAANATASKQRSIQREQDSKDEKQASTEQKNQAVRSSNSTSCWPSRSRMSKVWRPG